MDKLKLTIIGAGSSYTPEIIEGLSGGGFDLPITEIMLYDINEDRLRLMHDFCIRYSAGLKFKCDITASTQRSRALEASDYIITQIRVGGSKARINDEKIPLKYGFVGQETTGAGGFLKALRTVPAIIDIIKDIEKICPDARVLNYTNPTGIITEAVSNVSDISFYGLCAGGFFPREGIAKALGVDEASVHYDYFGLNHLNFAYNIKVDGRPLTEAEFDIWADKNGKFDPGFLKMLRLIPSPYLKLYYNSREYVEKYKEGRTRGETVAEIETELFDSLKDKTLSTKPAVLNKRGGGGYSKIALGVMDSMYNNTDKGFVINTQNKGTVGFLPDDAVIETMCLVNKSGVKPLKLTDIPYTIRGLVCAVKNYEQLAVKAAVSGEINTARLALIAHPLVMDYDQSVKMLDEMLLANKQYLPQFFK